MGTTDQSTVTAHIPAWQAFRRDEFICDVRSTPDHEGKQTFALFWRTNYIPGHPVKDFCAKWRLVRGQMYRAVVATHLALAKDNGKKFKFTGAFAPLQ